MFVGSKDNKIRLPDVMMVGAAKAGSTSLYRILASHDDIFFPDSQKEPFYFCNEGRYPMQCEQAIERMVWKTSDYLNLYKEAPDSALLVDGSTSYLYRPVESITHMRSMYGEALVKVKCIIILRDPTDRAYSHYTFLRLNGFEDMEFSEAIQPEVASSRKHERWGFDYLKYGDYHSQVEAYLKAFPQSLVLLTEDLKDMESLQRRLTGFLDLSPPLSSGAVGANPSGVPANKGLVHLLRRNRILKGVVNVLPEKQKHKLLGVRDKMLKPLLHKHKLDGPVDAELRMHYLPMVERLEGLIGRDLNHWKPKKDVRST